MRTKFDMKLLKKAMDLPIERRFFPLVMVYSREQWLNDEVLQSHFGFTEQEIETALQNSDGVIGEKNGYFCIVGLTKKTR